MILCAVCHRHFYDDRCLEFHREKKICESWRRCDNCCKEYDPRNVDHECYVGRCRSCREEMELDTHQCYIQPIDPEEDLPKPKPKALYKRQKERNPEVSPYFEPPIFVYADFEAMLEEDGTHLPILVYAETGESNQCYTFYGKECTGEFLDWLDTLIYGTETDPIPDEDQREVIVVFHNLKGYDNEKI